MSPESIRYRLADKLEAWLESHAAKGIKVGDHMRVFTPAVDNKIPPNTAEIHFSNEYLPFLGSNESLLNYARSFRSSALSSLQILAYSCQNHDPQFEGIETFYGISPLANHFIENLGFNISEIGLFQKIPYSIKYKIYVLQIAGINKYWQKFFWDINIPHKATITRETLIANFASRKSSR